MSIAKELASTTAEFQVGQEEIEGIDRHIRSYSYDYDLARTAEANAENSEVKTMLSKTREHAERRKNFYTLLKSSLTTGDAIFNPEHNPYTNDVTYVPRCEVILEGTSFKLGLFEIMDTVNLLTSKSGNTTRVNIIQRLQNGELVSFRSAPTPSQG